MLAWAHLPRSRPYPTSSEACAGRALQGTSLPANSSTKLLRHCHTGRFGVRCEIQLQLASCTDLDHFEQIRFDRDIEDQRHAVANAPPLASTTNGPRLRLTSNSGELSRMQRDRDAAGCFSKAEERYRSGKERQAKLRVLCPMTYRFSVFVDDDVLISSRPVTLRAVRYHFQTTHPRQWRHQ